MPYDASRDEYYWLGAGYTQLPGRDGTGFHEEYPTPEFFTAWFELNQHVKSNKTILQFVFVGKWYKGSDKITGIPGSMEMSLLMNEAVTKPAIIGGTSEEEKATFMAGASDPCQKLVGIYFRILD